MVQSDVTIEVPWQLSTGSILDYLFDTAVGILFEILRINCDSDNIILWEIIMTT